jgi:capsid portal protein
MNDKIYKESGGYMNKPFVEGATAVSKESSGDKASSVFCAPMPQVFGDRNLHGLSAAAVTIKKEQGTDPQQTNQTTSSNSIFGTSIPHAVNISVVRDFKDISPHHAACIQAKKFSMVGLGFVSEGEAVEEGKGDAATTTSEAESRIVSLLTGESFVQSKVDEKLDPLTLEGFYLELYRAVEDFLDGGTGYLEVVRDDNNTIIGINWTPYEDLEAAVFKDKDNKNWAYYKYKPKSGGSFGQEKKYFLFGINNRQAVYDQFYTNNEAVNVTDISEVISFKEPSNRSRAYGYPDWLSASSIITLLALAIQYKSDFYTNRGVLAYILSVVGAVNPKTWDSIVAAVQGSVGGGNNFRNLAINLEKEGSAVQLDKLASTDKTELQFSKDSEVYAQQIVSAHRVPPILANILIPGKLGASNETVQAMIAFQLLNVGPKQEIIQKVLSRTLAGKEGVPDLEPEDFRLRKITSQFNIAGLLTVGGMREEAPGATDEDGNPRDVSQGVKD